jgi:hypothetical protein
VAAAAAAWEHHPYARVDDPEPLGAARRAASGGARSLLAAEEALQHPGWSLWRRSTQLMVHYNGSSSGQQQARLLQRIEATGAVVSGYLPDHTWLVIGDPEALQRAAGGEGAGLLWLVSPCPHYPAPRSPARPGGVDPVALLEGP